jgi:hypothetical protein
MDEKSFQEWFAEKARKAGINPNPDDPAHFYDYRAAYSAGVEPKLNEEGKYKWPSLYKREGHPNMVVDGVNTKTGKYENVKRLLEKGPGE